MSELLPCPFCGEEAELIEYEFVDYITLYVVACTNDDCNMTVDTGSYANQREAIETWNTRAGCENCAALNRAAGLWAKADKRARDLERTCKVIEMHEHVTMDEPDIAELSCGHDIMVFDMEPPNYCPICGMRVEP